MNIFALDNDPKIAAQMHCDKHCVKMCLESTQIISTVIREQLPDINLYKPTHKNHPCVLWVNTSWENMHWFCIFTQELFAEYTFRYNRTHKSEGVFKQAVQLVRNLDITTSQFYKYGLTPFAQAMPENYKESDSINAYRNYYIGEKSHLLNYTKRNAPKWIEEKRLKKTLEIL